MSKPQANLALALVENAAGPSDYNDSLNSYTEASSTQATPEELTGTDLVGRQLISDYLSLANNGQATDDNLSALAEKYVDSIPTLISAEQVAYADFTYSDNSHASLEKYGKDIEGIYRQYATKLLALQSMAGLKNIVMGTDFSVSMKKVGDLYQDTANKMKEVAVPKLLAEKHLNLTNAYLKNAAAALSLTVADDDPTRGFAGLIMLSDSTDNEASLLVEIQQILTTNGI